MATEDRRNQGKTEFVKNVLSSNPYANAVVVNKQWSSAGRSGTISETLVNKMRAELGLAGNLRKRKANLLPPAPEQKPSYSRKKRGRKPGLVARNETSVIQNGKPTGDKQTQAASRNAQLTTLEAEIDILLFKVMNVGGLVDVENALRSSRRLLYKALDSDNS